MKNNFLIWALAPILFLVSLPCFAETDYPTKQTLRDIRFGRDTVRQIQYFLVQNDGRVKGDFDIDGNLELGSVPDVEAALTNAIADIASNTVDITSVELLANSNRADIIVLLARTNASDIIVAHSPANYTPSDASVEAHIVGIDSALSILTTNSPAQLTRNLDAMGFSVTNLGFVSVTNLDVLGTLDVAGTNLVVNGTNIIDLIAETGADNLGNGIAQSDVDVNGFDIVDNSDSEVSIGATSDITRITVDTGAGEISLGDKAGVSGTGWLDIRSEDQEIQVHNSTFLLDPLGFVLDSVTLTLVATSLSDSNSGELVTSALEVQRASNTFNQATAYAVSQIPSDILWNHEMTNDISMNGRDIEATPGSGFIDTNGSAIFQINDEAADGVNLILGDIDVEQSETWLSLDNDAGASVGRLLVSDPGGPSALVEVIGENANQTSRVNVAGRSVRVGNADSHEQDFFPFQADVMDLGTTNRYWARAYIRTMYVDRVEGELSYSNLVDVPSAITNVLPTIYFVRDTNVVSSFNTATDTLIPGMTLSSIDEGGYLILGVIAIQANNGSAEVTFTIYKNGIKIDETEQAFTPKSNMAVVSYTIRDYLDLAAGDSLDIRVRLDAGNSVDIERRSFDAIKVNKVN